MEETIVENMIDAVQKLSAILAPLQAEPKTQTTRKALRSIAKLESLLTDESAPIDDDTFYAKTSYKQMESVRGARLTARENIDEAKLAHGEGATLDDKIDRADALLERARGQIIRYGICAFFANRDIEAPSDAGVKARKKLRSIWDLHKVDQPILDYLGAACKDKVEHILKLDAKTTPASKNKLRAQPEAETGAKRRKK